MEKWVGPQGIQDPGHLGFGGLLERLRQLNLPRTFPMSELNTKIISTG